MICQVLLDPAGDLTETSVMVTRIGDVVSDPSDCAVTSTAVNPPSLPISDR